MWHGIMFDFDGVLLPDSIPIMLDMFHAAAREAGVHVPTREQLKTCLGPPLREYLSAVGKEVEWTRQQVEEVREQYIRISGAWEYEPCPTVAHTLNTLLGREARMTIVSNRRLDSIRTILGQIGVRESFFLLIQGKDESPYHKPDPRALAPSVALFAEHGVMPEHCLYVGDVIGHDMAAARAHNPPISFVGITSGATTRDEFLAAGLEPNQILESIVGLDTILPHA